MTLGLDILLLTIDPNLQMVRDREYTGHAMRAADLIELIVAGRLTLEGRWAKFIHVVDAQPTGDPLLDSSLARLALSPKRLMPTDWMARPPGGGAVEEGLAALAAQRAVRLYTRQVTRRLTLTEPTLLDPDRQAGSVPGWTGTSPPEARPTSWIGRSLDWSTSAACGFPAISTGPPSGSTRKRRAASGAGVKPTRWRRGSGS